ncbi:MAG: heavy-metal-associated domain-containing protein [Acidobacteriota bacterium]
MNSIELKVPAISCGHCARAIKSEIGEMPGIKTIDVDVQSKRVKVDFETPATEAQIKIRLAEINYPPEA